MVFILTALFATTGCFGDPVKSDLAEYIKFENTANKEVQSLSSDFMSKANSVSNKEEKLKFLNEGMQNLAAITEKQKNYKPKTKEVQDIHNKAVKALESSVEGFSELIQAVKSDTVTQETVNAMNKRQQDIQKLNTEY